MTDYSQAKIYKLYSVTEPSRAFIGVTMQELDAIVTKRRFVSSNTYKYFTDNYFAATGPSPYVVELVQNYPCSSFAELQKKAREIVVAAGPGAFVNSPPTKQKKRQTTVDSTGALSEEKLARLKYLKEEIVCECGAKFQRKYKTTHNKTNYHYDYVKRTTQKSEDYAHDL